MRGGAAVRSLTGARNGRCGETKTVDQKFERAIPDAVINDVLDFKLARVVLSGLDQRAVTFNLVSANMRMRETWTVTRSPSGLPKRRIPRMRGEGTSTISYGPCHLSMSFSLLPTRCPSSTYVPTSNVGSFASLRRLWLCFRCPDCVSTMDLCNSLRRVDKLVRWEPRSSAALTTLVFASFMLVPVHSARLSGCK